MPILLTPSLDFSVPWIQGHWSKGERRPRGNQSAEKAKWLLRLSHKSPLACENLRIHCSDSLQFPWLAGRVPCNQLLFLLCFVPCAEFGFDNVTCTNNPWLSQKESDTRREERRIWGTTKRNSNPSWPGGIYLVYLKGNIWDPGEWNFNY